MSSAILIVIIILGGIVLMTIVDLFTMPINDFLEKTVKKTVWLWLPFHVLKRLTHELKKKYTK